MHLSLLPQDPWPLQPLGQYAEAKATIRATTSNSIICMIVSYISRLSAEFLIHTEKRGALALWRTTHGVPLAHGDARRGAGGDKESV